MIQEKKIKIENTYDNDNKTNKFRLDNMAKIPPALANLSLCRNIANTSEIAMLISPLSSL